jgi:signal transduction histidine kinase
LGLPIAQRAITQLGGTVSVESTLGVGTVFTLQLPISETPAVTDELRTELEMKHQQALAYARDLQTLYRQFQQTNKQLQDVNTQLEEANQLKSNFLGIVSHELRSPLVPIDLALQAFPRYGTANLKPEQRALLEQLNHSFQNIRQMIDGLVEYATLLSKQGRLNLGAVNMADLINETAAALIPMASRRGLDLSAQVPPDLILPAGDQERIKDAVWHLLHNTIKFTAASGKILLRAFGDGSRIVVEVQDTGIVLSLEEQDQLWEPFAQLTDSLQRGATGMGLALVRYVAVAHGGDVTLQSEPGKGSVFGFWLPIRAISS